MDGKSLVELDLGGLNVSHVDEVVSVIPVGTGYAVAIEVSMNLAFTTLANPTDRQPRRRC